MNLQRSAAWLMSLLLIVPNFAGGAGGATAPGLVTAPTAPTAEDRSIVACLLPSRVRKLGRLMYPERRQLIKSTARKCNLMGGEYTTYDRAAPEASAAFFLPLAEAGDPTAQTSLGEVYEYLFDEPRHADAALWYRRAADQGDRTAMRRLAHLHERGLGVPADALLAANLWRASAGLTDDLVLASELESVRSAAELRVAQLARDLRARGSEVEALQLTLTAERNALAQRRDEVARLERARIELAAQVERARSAPAAPDDGRVLALERQAEERARQIEQQRFEIASLEAALGAQEAQVTAGVRRLQLENERLAAELARVSQISAAELQSTRAALAEQTAEVARLDEERRRLTDDLERTSSASDRAEAAATAAARAELDEVSVQLERAQRATGELQARLDQAVADRERADAELARLESELVAARTSAGAAEARLAEARSALAVAVADRERTASELASASAANAAERDRLRAALAERERAIAGFQERLAQSEAEAGRTRAETERLRDEWSAQIATRGGPEPLPDTSTLRIPRELNLGQYHALVIGNNNYQTLRPLNFAHNDARAVHELLSEQYGFRSELMLDTTRNEIFARLESLSDTLRPQDALLIYYAGHGVEDGRSSYWLGVDAPSMRSGLQTHGISSAELGQWLSVLEARHVMVIADSCYSGAGIETTGGMKFTAADVQTQLKFFLQNRARTAMTSGANGPVPDGGSGANSVFTGALIDLLQSNRGVLFDTDLYAHLREQVRASAVAVATPEPVFGRIEVAGHGAGQFAFIRPHLTES